MKAAIWTSYGSPENSLEIREVDIPEVSENDLLIKVQASTVTLGDCEIRGSYLPLWTRIPLKLFLGVFKPRGTKILGQECAGEIIETGSDVTEFAVGDRIVAITGIGMRAHAQYLVLSTKSATSVICKIPDEVSYEYATTLPVGGVNALYFTRLANLQPGDKFLINGAGGSIGTYAIQIAKLAGAEVTAIDLEVKFDMLHSLGADHCIDFTKEDVTRSDKKYDAIFDIVGKLSLRRSKTILNPGGKYITANPMINTMIRSKFISKFTDYTFIAGIASGERRLIEELLVMLQEEKIEPYIDKYFDLDDIIAAHQYVETGRKQGHLLLQFD